MHCSTGNVFPLNWFYRYWFAPSRCFVSFSSRTIVLLGSSLILFCSIAFLSLRIVAICCLLFTTVAFTVMLGWVHRPFLTLQYIIRVSVLFVFFIVAAWFTSRICAVVHLRNQIVCRAFNVGFQCKPKIDLNSDDNASWTIVNINCSRPRLRSYWHVGFCHCEISAQKNLRMQFFRRKAICMANN